ncbi:MAG TPA: MaoC family dehydratase [Candidatus Sulfotelmatobacter sp.]|nr:MaoC family dehydratase [Candidatus Sulfotelmatobacter sp.]
MAKRANIDAVRVGDAHRVSKTISESDVYQFAGITGDFHPIHVNEEYARDTQFKGRIAHGALAVGMMSAAIGGLCVRIPPPGVVSKRYEVTFTAPIYFGDTITAEVTVAEKHEDRNEIILRALATNQRGETVLEGRTVQKIL